MMFNFPLILSVIWCSLGYVFLDRGESSGAILASMASLSMAWFAIRDGSPEAGAGEPDDFRPRSLTWAAHP